MDVGVLVLTIVEQMWNFATTTCLYILTDGQMSGVITEVTVNESGDQSESR